jgi:myo-inositol-1(or 4)-monophosphatase
LTIRFEYLRAGEEAARAGARVLKEFAGKVAFREKAPRDLVTDADIQAQRVIFHQLKQSFPEHLLLGEESSQHDGQVTVATLTETTQPVWIVDPIDGTTNFAHGLAGYCVSIGLYIQGQIEVGIIYDPLSDECFTAMRGHGAQLNGSSIQVSGCTDISRALVAAGFSADSRKNEIELARFGAMFAQCQSIRRLGSAALNLCYVACGRLDGYWATSVQAWDVAAGLLILQESKGISQNLQGLPVSLIKPELVAAATPALASRIQQILAPYV